MAAFARRGLILFCLLAPLSWYFWGLMGLLLTTLLFATVLGRNIAELIVDARRGVRHVRFREVNGSYYSFQGIAVQVVEDDDYSPWIPADVVRKIVGHGASDRMLALTYPDGWCEMGKPPKGHLRDDALLMYLAKEQSLRGIKFKVWVERNIAHQANKQRQRFGVRISDPRAPDLMPHHLRDTVVPRDMQSTLPQS
jgi:hypothetical protein